MRELNVEDRFSLSAVRRVIDKVYYVLFGYSLVIILGVGTASPGNCVDLFVDSLAQRKAGIALIVLLIAYISLYMMSAVTYCLMLLAHIRIVRKEMKAFDKKFRKSYRRLLFSDPSFKKTCLEAREKVWKDNHAFVGWQGVFHCVIMSIVLGLSVLQGYYGFSSPDEKIEIRVDAAKFCDEQRKIYPNYDDLFK